MSRSRSKDYGMAVPSFITTTERYKYSDHLSNKAVGSENSPLVNARARLETRNNLKTQNKEAKGANIPVVQSGEDVKAPIEVGIDGEIGRGGFLYGAKLR